MWPGRRLPESCCLGYRFSFGRVSGVRIIGIVMRTQPSQLPGWAKGFCAQCVCVSVHVRASGGPKKYRFGIDGDCMKKWIGYGLAVVAVYFSAVFVRAELEERKAEKRTVEILTEVASPWNAALMRKNGSEWLLNRAPLPPEKIAELAANDLGSLQEITDEAACNLEAGNERGSTEKKIWAICNVTGRFDKKTATLKIRLIAEPTPRPSFFGPLGDSLKLNDFMSIEIQR